jgi:histone H3/H4
MLRASAKCQGEKRKTINGDDLLWAMETLQVCRLLLAR